MAGSSPAMTIKGSVAGPDRGGPVEQTGRRGCAINQL
jgi:hypothetical protein